MADEMTPPPAPPAGDGGRPGPAGDTSKLLAALSYPLWIVGLVAILIDPYKDEKFVKFHAFQAIFLNIGGWIVLFILNIVLMFIPCVGSIIGMLLFLALLVYLILLAMKAYKGEYFEVPVIYGLMKGMVGE